jgi:hypothetical protein
MNTSRNQRSEKSAIFQLKKHCKSHYDFFCPLFQECNNFFLVQISISYVNESARQISVIFYHQMEPYQNRIETLKNHRLFIDITVDIIEKVLRQLRPMHTRS